MIEQRYEEIIRQCEARFEELSEWEQMFLHGDPTKKSVALIKRTWLSDGQKAILDRIVSERFEGKKFKREMVTKFGIIDLKMTDDGRRVTIGNYPVGKGITKKEGSIINSWLSTALSGILSIPKDVVVDFLDGTSAEVPETAEFPGPEVQSTMPTSEPQEGNTEDEF